MQLLADLTPLRESPAFRRLWAGTTRSAVGGAMTSFALTLQVWDLTRSTVAVGLVALVILVPLLAVGVFGGAVIDAVDTRRLVLATTLSGGLLDIAGTAAIALPLPLPACTGWTSQAGRARRARARRARAR